MRIRAGHLLTNALLDLEWSGSQLSSIGPAGTGPVDYKATWVAPALFDLQINGCLGLAFSSDRLQIEDVARIAHVLHQHGVAGFCPTLVTNSFEVLQHGFATLARACDQDAELARCLPVFHLEGPYISPEDGPRGAHCKAFIRAPDADEFQRLQDAAGGRIRLVTLAPEMPGALAFIERLVSQGVVVSIGHTAAAGPQIRDAVQAGARLSTHLGNGAHAVLPRHDNYLWEQLDCAELWTSVIADGYHLPPPVLRCILNLKTPARTILTCDASSLAGLPPGRYQEWGQEYEVLASGKIVVPGTPFLAGSGLFTDSCVRHAVSVGRVALADALEMAGARPRTLLGLPAVELAVGQMADLVLFESGPDNAFRLVATIVGGRVFAPIVEGK